MGQKSSSPITEVRLRRALRTVANAIECHGEVYWPIFEALKAELDARNARRAQLAEYRKPANDKSTSNAKDKIRQVHP
ncbi:hypothetical protein [Hyphomonas pacifica]|uniref:hypothetical protein n=1 Tax=Hyphomonas pacifica TaxID=1280941 RepID=UPI000DBF5F6B|nr:hypothetical protein [Hyphomonas pacifica]RAN35271.1 hypothetical protein HY11_14215 [Hyphomonas pacifica]|tara:strand:+ start:161 stop:394 length:234 start_codon:yes stop_codon:yes gene_type:complete